jgi:FG-GAP-like repeat
VLPSGVFLLSGHCGPIVDALFNATTLSWTATGVPSVGQGEVGFTLMQTGQVLMVDVRDPPNAQAYNPATSVWSPIAQTPVALPDTCGTDEIGPAVTRPDGTVVAFGGNTCTASPADPVGIYNPFNNIWTLGPYVPATCGTNGTTSCTLADAAAVVLPNGNVLFSASAGFNQKPSHLFEFTTANTINQVPDDNFATNAFGASYVFLMLPTGQALTTIFCTCLEFYDPSGSPNPAWAPSITSSPTCVAPNSSYVLAGIQLNGLSQGAAYGDDFQSATNYPLIRIVNNTTGHVFYARTSGFSTMSIAPRQAGSANFKVAAATELGGSLLYVVTNGIPSAGKFVTVDTSCAANARTHDFNGDGMSDIIWRDGSGNVAFWLMSGAGILSSGGVGGVPATWSIVGQRDFNGDGKADLLWRDNLGNTAIWFMNGTAVASTTGVGNIPTNWSVVGTGDFNGDGIGDILWTDGSGNYAVWLMNGATVSSSAGLGNIPASWSVAGTGDFNGDGKTDILWRDNLGNTSIWFMNGTAVASAAGVGNIPTSWSVVGTGDFNGDGMSDIVWHDNLGNTSVWLMNGANVLMAGGLGNIPTTWAVAQTGDYNGDGMSDLLWRDNQGNTSIWFMNGAAVSSTGGFGNIPTNWTVQSVNAE